MALRADGRAEFRQTEMPPNALCHLESRQPPAFELSANGHLTGGDQYPVVRATTVPQHTRYRSRKNSSRCASGTVACEEGEWSAFGPKTLFAIGRQVRAGLDSATAQEGTPRRTESAIAARSLFEATEMYPGAERWPPGYSGRMPARSPQTPAAQRLNPARPQPGSGDTHPAIRLPFERPVA